MTHQFTVRVVAAWVLAAAAGAQGPFSGHQVHRVTVRDQKQLIVATNLSETVWNCTPGVGPIDIQLSPEKRPAFEAWADELGLERRLLIPDVQVLIDAEREQIERTRRQRNVDWFTTYRTLAEIHARLDELAAAFPELATTFVAGQTLQGRDIKGIRFTGPESPGNPRAQRPQVMFEGLQHAREWISPAMNMWIADRMLEQYAADARIRAIVDTTEVIVVPVINADGYVWTWASSNNRLWRKNRRDNGNGTTGVDLNRNWGYQWGGEGASTAPNNDTYRGTGPFSEPETVVTRDFISSLPRLKAHIDFHSYSQLILSPWGYTRTLCPDDALFARINTFMASDIYAVHQKTYVGGPAYTTIYPASGVAPDWVYGDRGALAWTIELRDTGQFGFILPADQIIPTCEENFAAVLSLCDFVRTPLWMSLPVGTPPFAEPETHAPVRVSVKDGMGTLDPGTVMLHVRPHESEAFTAIPMTVESGSLFAGELPPSRCGDTLEYYFTARSAAGQSVTYPEGGAVLSTRIAARATVWADTFETDRGWSGADASDTATAGRWQRADPEPTAAQPGDDSDDPGVLCWITGAAAGASVGANDVDGGTTTLTSLGFSALPPPFTRVYETGISYARWYSNNAGSAPNQDSMPVELSRDGGATWSQLELVTENAGAWVRRTHRISDPITDAMRLRFIARDLGAGSIVEAGVDDVKVELISCPITGDINRDGGVDGGDVEFFFRAWESGHRLGDFNEDGGIDGADVEEFFRVWERG